MHVKVCLLALLFVLHTVSDRIEQRRRDREKSLAIVNGKASAQSEQVLITTVRCVERASEPSLSLSSFFLSLSLSPLLLLSAGTVLLCSMFSSCSLSSQIGRQSKRERN